ncbi:hypothetical protein KIN20_001299 [Parelaphostrongylus tenuis]|uniref:Uncharacterized protein n=1 Tax=Parelaphostrongylus tenuis TaxID=148309 RepID=A0AAD5LXW8_PARTN|nr:hypothetical protein KIN20_001299 [Parelaphostrongylus tenuis]
MEMPTDASFMGTVDDQRLTVGLIQIEIPQARIWIVVVLRSTFPCRELAKPKSTAPLMKPGDRNEQWILIPVGSGDFLSLPVGIQHRFAADRNVSTVEYNNSLHPWQHQTNSNSINVGLLLHHPPNIIREAIFSRPSILLVTGAASEQDQAHLTNTQMFLNRLRNASPNNAYVMESFDVTALYTSVSNES